MILNEDQEIRRKNIYNEWLVVLKRYVATGNTYAFKE